MLDLEVQARGQKGSPSLLLLLLAFSAAGVGSEGTLDTLGAAQQHLSTEWEPHEEPEHGNSSPKAVSQTVTNPVQTWKVELSYRLCQFPSLPQLCDSSGNAANGRCEHMKGNPGKNLYFSVEKPHPPELPWIWRVCARGSCCWSPPVQGSHAVTPLSHSTPAHKGQNAGTPRCEC